MWSGFNLSVDFNLSGVREFIEFRNSPRIPGIPEFQGIQECEKTVELNFKRRVKNYSVMNPFNSKARSPKRKNFSQQTSCVKTTEE